MLLPTRPVGNCANRSVVPSLDVYASRSADRCTTIAPSTRITDVSSNPNFEQFSGCTVPFLVDYIWVSSLGDTSFGVWTDYRNTVGGMDLREAGDNDNDLGADVLQCRTALPDGSITGDACPRAGGLDQDIYGDKDALVPGEGVGPLGPAPLRSPSECPGLPSRWADQVRVLPGALKQPRGGRRHDAVRTIAAFTAAPRAGQPEHPDR